MTMLAQESDLENIAGEGFPSSVMDQALSWATSVITGYCGRDFDYHVLDTVFLDPHRGTGLLPNVPVVTVNTVQGWMPQYPGGGMAWVTLTNYQVNLDTGLLYDTTGLPGSAVWLGPSWPWLPGSLQVNYNHGFETIPPDLTNVCVRLAYQWINNPGLFMHTRVGAVETSFSGSAGTVLQDMDRAILDRYVDITVS